MMNRVLCFSIIAFAVLSCSSDDDLAGRESSCLSLLSEDMVSDFCQSPEDLEKDSTLCNYLVTDIFRLTDLSKSYLKQYCMNYSEILRFQNSAEEEITFKVKDKYHSFESQGASNIRNCPGDTSKTSAYCMTSEVASLQLISEELDLELHLTLNTNIILEDSWPTDFVDVMDYHVKGPIDTNLYYRFFITDPRESSYDSIRGQEFYPVIELNGYNFYNVVTVNPEINPAVVSSTIKQFYFSQDHGLVGIVNREDELFTVIP